ncbi:tRNA-splicing endonuclease-like protein [Zopfia rhizophila CBS 207.26]|uniref:tRNA-splicing endonuclease-like protein n=1 Tax=Zopfia rhizophila CBS 207.26 TaxID=1314779 RepID=A0A6A6EIK4_9PEZI|nr:tRNA-splicing endonuclease-like protein [Zopfia rhizophila CBS 207.26]
MAEIVEKIQEIQSLPANQHLFCPRKGEDASVYYDEDIAGFEQEEDAETVRVRKQKIEQVQQIKWLTLDALQILAFDGDDANAHKDWLTERLDGLMASCDVCIRVFHQSRAEWKHRLVEQYEEDQVADFLDIVDKTCLKRIQDGLDTANAVLLEAEPKLRGVKILPTEATYAFFESLSCKALIGNEELLQRHFDAPFKLVQTKKRLKLQTFVPAMTRFLFCKNEERQEWAFRSWSLFKRSMLSSEFDWAVRDYLVEAMLRVQMSNLDINFVATFWVGVKLIVNLLDKDLITYSLRGLDGDFYRLLLDHLSLNSEGFFDLVDTMRLLLEKSPTDFWDAMGAISPSTATVVEQVFNSPILKQLLLSATEDDEDHLRSLDNAFTWIPPFISSIKPANLAPACRALANQLFNRLQSDQFSRASRAHCFKQGLRVLDHAFRRLNEGKTRSQFVGQPTVNAMLELLSPHIELIVTSLKRFGGLQFQEEPSLILSMIQNAFTLECLSLEIERQCIIADAPSPTETPPSSPIWKTIITAIDANNLELASHMLLAGRNLVGLEKFFVKSSVAYISPAVRHFNGRFDLLSQTITEIIDKLGSLEPAQLDGIFEHHLAATAIIANLFSSSVETRNSTIELLKVISSEDERREAIQHILKAFFDNSLRGFSESCRQVVRKRIFAPAPSMIKTCTDVIDVMCNSQDGMLRSRALEGREAKETMKLWQNLWNALTTIFRTTEDWSNMGYEKTMMMDFCRDTMQFADYLFDQCSILATVLKETPTGSGDESSRTDPLKDLLEWPAKTMEGMAKWLRLRDEFLSSKSVTLISKLLIRLKGVGIEVEEATLSYMERVLTGDVRAKLSMQQQAELQRALETHLGHSLVKVEEPIKQPKQGSLSKWMTSGTTATETKLKEGDARSKLLAETTRSYQAFKARRESIRGKETETAQADRKTAEQAEFKRRRQLEMENLKKEKAAAIARAKQNTALRGWSEHTAEAGSGLEGLGVLGKDHAPKGEGLMHSSGESDEEGDFDEELFGVKKVKNIKSGPKTSIINEVKAQVPVKKRRVVRSIKDMRARLAPDLSPLHRIILSWDYYHTGDFPPNSRTDIYTAVPSTFRTSTDYQATFEPLLTLEAWQGFVKAREENVFKPYEIRIVSRASVDAFQEVGSTMTHMDNKDLNVSEGDVVLLSKSKNSSAQDPHCLARVFRITRKKDHMEVSYRVMPSNPLQSSLVPNGMVFGAKIQSITPLEREYGALLGLQYYDLCDEIIRAKPSPLLDYNDKQLSPLISNYRVNKAQAKAVKSAIDNDAFTLIQGPPGSGKTKTIVAIVGAILSDSLRQNGTVISVPGQGPRSDTAPKKLLVCAPSNAAVDELVMRFKEGIKTLSGQERKLNIVRLGRSDAINANVQDVTLDELVNKELGVNPSNGNGSEATRQIFQEHQQVSEQLRQVRAQLDAGTAKGEKASKLQDDFNALRKHKADLGTKIDSAKDNERLASRQADLNRRRAQEKILGNAHVICATLSGSGHEMFQGLNIEFETVIVDEAAQCVEMSALIPLKYGCAKCILVGDPKQLPPTVFSKEAARFQYEQSLFVRMQGNHPNDVHLLDTQYRMHPEISLFPSQTFYDGRLLDGNNMAGLRKRPWHSSLLLSPYRFFDVQGQHQAAPKGHSLINIAEIDVAMQLFDRLSSDYGSYDFKGKIGIITPYKSQLRELKVRFARKYTEKVLEEVEFNTTDAFQGRESEVIIFSCVRASPAGGIGFLQDIRRMNVGLTRAKSSLWVLGNSQSLVRGEYWRKLVEDAKQRDRYTEGNLMNMLRQHSSAFPAPVDRNVSLPSHPQQIKENRRGESMSRSASNHSNSSSYDSKPVTKELVDRFGSVTNRKRRPRSRSDEDVEMEDVPSESEQDSRSNTASGRSTPAVMSDATRNSPMPEMKEIKQEAAASRVGDVVGGMARPKIKKRPKEVDPFIRRQPPKKPRAG